MTETVDWSQTRPDLTTLTSSLRALAEAQGVGESKQLELVVEVVDENGDSVDLTIGNEVEIEDEESRSKSKRPRFNPWKRIRNEPEEPKGLFKCSICPKFFIYLSKIHRHLVKDHLIDSRGQLDRWVLKDNFSEKTTNDDPQMCPYCLKHYKTKASMERHIRLKHSNAPPRIKCRVCLTLFTQKSDMQRHFLRKHEHLYHAEDLAGWPQALDDGGGPDEGEPEEVVELVIADVPSDDDVNSRLEPATGNDDDRLNSVELANQQVTLICPDCSKEFEMKAGIGRHVAINHQGDQLNAEARSWRNLKRSYVSCSLKCLHCPTQFSSTSELEQHFKTVHRDIIDEDEILSVCLNSNQQPSATDLQATNSHRSHPEILKQPKLLSELSNKCDFTLEMQPP